jgi:cell division protein FtsB
MTQDIGDFLDIERRWSSVTKGYAKLTFEQAQADMQALLAEARKVQDLKRRVAELEAHVHKRNNDMQSFASEVARLANQKYADYSQ